MIERLKFDYSWLSLSRHRLSRITAYLEVKIWTLPKHENLTKGKKYYGKEEKLLLRSNFSSFPLYFQYISNFKSPITHIYLLNVVNRIIFSSSLQIWYVEVRISRSISECPLEFEITRVDCINYKRLLAVLTGITKTRLFKYIETFTSKNWKFSYKKTLIFFIYLLIT